MQIPENVSDEEGILLGDILSTAFFCAENAFGRPLTVQPQGGGAGAKTTTTGTSEDISARRSEMPFDSSTACTTSDDCTSPGFGPPPAVLVVGCGPVGLLSILASKHMGGGQVREEREGGIIIRNLKGKLGGEAAI